MMQTKIITDTTINHQKIILKTLDIAKDYLGEQYLNNVDHGLRHSKDLIAHAHQLTNLLNSANKIDWKCWKN